MIQDIFPHKLNNSFVVGASIENNDRLIVFSGKNVLIREGDGVEFPDFSDLSEFYEADECTYLFAVDDEKYFMVEDKGIEVKGLKMAEFQTIRGKGYEPLYRVFALYTAKHLADWYRDNKYCGRCGKFMKHSDKERCMVCDCGYHSYPRIMPAVIVGVTNGDKLLLTKYRSGYKHNALVAGFTEIGETAEETVAREVMEETGIRVKNIRYYKSQPWGSANDLLLGYFCDVDGDDTIRLDDNELKYADWVERKAIELQPDSLSLTNEMMKKFKNGLI